MNADEKTCPRCAETIKRPAQVCRYCGHEFAEAQPSPSTWLPGKPAELSKQKSMQPKKNNYAIGCLGVVLILILIGTFSSPPETDSNTTEDVLGRLETSTNATIEPITSQEPPNDWNTYSRVDQLREKPVHYASVTSENSVDFDFPYNGGSTLTMTVRRHPKYGDDVIVQISKGQFVCGIYNCRGSVNFGSGAQSITLNEPEDNSSDTLFIEGSSSIITKLKKSDRVIIELPFYQEGNRQFTFQTKGLVWPPKAD